MLAFPDLVPVEEAVPASEALPGTLVTLLELLDWGDNWRFLWEWRGYWRGLFESLSPLCHELPARQGTQGPVWGLDPVSCTCQAEGALSPGNKDLTTVDKHPGPSLALR